jgi:uncharacterized protein YecT (DUF1311 family)
MSITSTLRLGGTLLLTLCIAAGALADAPRATGLDRLMTGAYCADCASTECAQVELAVAEDLMDAQLRQAAGALRLGRKGNEMLESLYAAQAAWETYRDHQCALLVMHEDDGGDQSILRERCRFELTVERILDLAQLQEEIEATARRVTQAF